MKMEKIENQVQKLNNETCIHSKRVGFLAYALARELNFDKDYSKQIGIAAMTHDLGKKDINQDVLNKKGSLNEDEYNEIKRHPQAGYDSLMAVKDQFSPAQMNLMLDIALNHHERHSGGGYPNNKSGDEISKEANLVSMVDFFDAVAFERVYKKAWKNDKVIEVVKDMNGKAFKPEIADTFLANKEKFFVLKDYLGNAKDISIDNFDQEVENALARKGMKLGQETLGFEVPKNKTTRKLA